MRTRFFLSMALVAAALGLSACSAGYDAAEIRPDLSAPPRTGTGIAPAATAPAASSGVGGFQ